MCALPDRLCTMLVFIDDSGDPGFNLAGGSSATFAFAMVLFNDDPSAWATEGTIRRAAHRLKIHPEFKFNKCSDRVRDKFFQAVRQGPFSIRAIVVRKQSTYSPRLLSHKGEFYRYFIRQMMVRSGDALHDARVVIDGKGEPEFRRQLKVYFRRHLGDRLVSVKLGDSRKDPLVQLADMCVGAIARSYRTDRRNADRWHQMLRPRINDVWGIQLRVRPRALAWWNQASTPSGDLSGRGPDLLSPIWRRLITLSRGISATLGLSPVNPWSLRHGAARPYGLWAAIAHRSRGHIGPVSRDRGAERRRAVLSTNLLGLGRWAPG
jgi:hypothetical protein